MRANIGPATHERRAEPDDIARFEARRAGGDSFYMHAVGFDGRATLIVADLTAAEAIFLATQLDDEIRRDDPVD